MKRHPNKQFRKLVKDLNFMNLEYAKNLIKAGIYELNIL